MRWILLPLMLFSCVPVSGADPIARRLIGAKVIYDLPQGLEGPPDSQTWAADGTTVFDGGPGPFGGIDRGRWEMRLGRYCADFSTPPRPKAEWACWRVSLSDDGQRIHFVEIKKGLIVLFQREYHGRFVD